MDDQLAVPTDPELAQLLEQFVCVRLVQMWDVDLERFQFDFLQTWAVFLMNGDGTTYGRYGTRSGLREKSMADISLAGFKKTLVATLELHHRYQKDQAAGLAEVAGKQQQHREVWKTAQDIPKLKARKMAKPFRQGRGEHASCIHCHMIPNHEVKSLHDRKKPVPDRKIWPFPQPAAVGLQMDKREVATVLGVLPESAAASAGAERGDEILRFDGQTILSTADMQWVLHNAADNAKLELIVLRDGNEQKLSLKLIPGWRQKMPNWRFSNLNIMNWMVGFNGRSMLPGMRREAHLKPEDLAFQVGRINKKLLGSADLRKGDIIIEVDGKRDSLGLGEFIQYIASKKKPGSTLKLVRSRGGKERKLRVKVH